MKGDYMRSNEDLKWISDQRLEVLYICADLCEAIEIVNNKFFGLERVPEDLRYLLSSVSGCAFSLWRAVPLVNTSNASGSNLPLLKEYLRKVIEHNAITYNDDVIHNNWTCGYYLGNVRLRLNNIRNIKITGDNVDNEIALRSVYKNLKSD
jgi:hypothetical protein